MKSLEPNARKPRYSLRPWQVKLAAFLADTEHPPVATQVDVASRLAGQPVTYGQLKHLRKRADFRETVAKFREGGIEAARRLFVSDLPLYAELFRWGAERSREKDDTRGLATYAVAAADRILPKREAFDIAGLNQTIVIHMSPRQLALEQSEPIEITSEAIPNEPAAEPEPAPTKQLPPGLQTPAEAFDAARRRDAGRTRNPDPFA